ncbi:AcrR family transcriptional regulator [Mycobacteroides chelonae]|nr:AcrR family transcriptional regulator [Mycobacteroides chelonae]
MGGPKAREVSSASAFPIRQGRPRSEKSRLAILAATLELVEQKGLSALTIEAVAQRAGVGKATIYRWWPSRIALIVEAIEVFPELQVPDTGSLETDLVVLASQLRELLVTTPLGSILGHIASERDSLDPEVRRYVRDRMRGTRDVVDRAISRGELPQSVDRELFLNMINGPVLAHVFFGRTPPSDSMIIAIVRAAIAGSRYLA